MHVRIPRLGEELSHVVGELVDARLATVVLKIFNLYGLKKVSQIGAALRQNVAAGFTPAHPLHW